MKHEEVIMGIIVNAGETKSHSMKAISAARLGNFEEADREMVLAEETVSLAHKQQTQLIIEEAGGSKIEITLLMVHAQDHLMNAITVKDLANEIVGILKDRK